MRKVGHLDLGPLRLTLRSEACGQVRYADPAYAGFFAAPGPAAPLRPLREMPVDIVDRSETVPVGAPLWQAGQNWAIWATGEDLVIRAGIRAPEEMQRTCRVARDLSRAELALHPAADANGICPSPLRYPLDQILSWGLLAGIGGALLHAAVAVRAGVGWVFAGHSGAGKSTLAALCHAEGYRILNDDRVMVFRRAGEWKAAGTPWHGSGRFFEAAEVPLGGLFFLQKAAQDRLEPVSPSQARLALLNVASVPWFEEDWSQGILDGLGDLVQGVECARFHFTKTSAAVRTLAAHQDRSAGACA